MGWEIDYASSKCASSILLIACTKPLKIDRILRRFLFLLQFIILYILILRIGYNMFPYVYAERFACIDSQEMRLLKSYFEWFYSVNETKTLKKNCVVIVVLVFTSYIHTHHAIRFCFDTTIKCKHKMKESVWGFNFTNRIYFFRHYAIDCFHTFNNRIYCGIMLITLFHCVKMWE